MKTISRILAPALLAGAVLVSPVTVTDAQARPVLDAPEYYGPGYTEDGVKKAPKLCKVKFRIFWFQDRYEPCTSKHRPR